MSGVGLSEKIISIHALAKRATRYHSITDTVYRYFNPRPRKEGDITPFLYKYSTKGFQSTPSQRGRPDKVYTLKRNI